MTLARFLALFPPPQDDEEARLLAAIADHPDDDGLRLVYADHLLRRGDPRGELYAIQTELARGVGPWREHDLEERQGDLTRMEPRARRGDTIYRRGTPDGIRIDPTEIQDALPAHLQLMTWSTTRKEAVAEAFAKLSAHPRAADVRELDLGSMRDWGWEALLGASMRPRRLVMPTAWMRDIPPHGWLAAETAAALAVAPLCERVEQLELSAAVGDGAFAVLAEARWMAQVTSLRSGGITRFGTSHGLGHAWKSNGPMTDTSVQTMATHVPALRRLDLRWNRITEVGVRMLAESDLPLEDLKLSLDGLGVRGVEALAQSRLAKVARVYAGVHEATEPAAYRALIESPVWGERWIDLWVEKGFELGPIVDAIASARETPPIEELRIADGKLGFEQLERLLSSPAMASLKRLALVELQGTTPAGAFFARTMLRPLEGLHLERCNVGSEGLEAILASPHAAGLELLHLEDCHLGEVGVRVLARSSVRPVDLEVEDKATFASYLELLGSPVLARTEQLRLFLLEQFKPFDSASARRVLVEESHLANVRRLSLQGLEKFEKADYEALRARFGAALYHPSIYYK